MTVVFKGSIEMAGAHGAPYGFIVLNENQKSKISFIINMVHKKPRPARLLENVYE